MLAPTSGGSAGLSHSSPASRRCRPLGRAAALACLAAAACPGREIHAALPSNEIAAQESAGAPAGAGAQAGGFESGDPGSTEADEIRLLLKAKKFDLAEQRARALVERVRASQADQPASRYLPSLAEALKLLLEAASETWHATGPALRAMAEESLQVHEALYGADDPRIIPALVELGDHLLLQLEEPRAAQAIYERALAIQQGATGQESGASEASAGLFPVLAGLGRSLREQGRSEEALAVLERAREIGERTRGPDDPEVITILRVVARTLSDRGDLEGARDLFALAVERLASAGRFAEETWRDAVTGLASCTLALGRRAEARALLRHWVTRTVQMLPPDHLNAGMMLLDEGMFCVRTGDAGSGLGLIERSVQVLEESTGPREPYLGWALWGLAMTHVLLGDPRSAVRNQERAVGILEASFGEGHLSMMEALDYLVRLNLKAGDTVSARRHLDRVNALQERHAYPDEAELVPHLHALAACYMAQRDFASARSLIERSNKILESRGLMGHPELAHGVVILAEALRGLGNEENGGDARKEAIGILESEVRLRRLAHPLGRIKTLGALAELRYRDGDLAGAFRDALATEALSRGLLRVAASSLDERQALGFAANRVGGLDVLLSVLERHPDPGVTRNAWDALILSRAVVLDEIAARNREARAGGDLEVDRLAREVQIARRRYANLAVRGHSQDAGENYATRLERSRGDMERAERELAMKSSAFRREQRSERIGFADVVKALPPDAALVAFVRYRPVPSLSESVGPAPALAAEDQEAYMVFVMAPGLPDPTSVPLGPAGRVDRLIRRWVERISLRPSGSRTRQSQAEREARMAGLELRGALWDAIAGRLGGARRVFIVPDGEINLVNFAALPQGSGYLVELGPLLHLLSAERDLAAEDPPPGTPGSLLVVGDPAFDDLRAFVPGRAEPTPVAGGAGTVASVRPYRGIPASCGDFRSVRFSPLPASRREVSQVSALWRQRDGRVASLTGQQATEAAFKTAAPGHHVLHLATHGFFLGDRCGMESGGGGGPAEPVNPAPTMLRGDSPLLLAGLALSGANLRARAGLDEEDGILTSEEIAALDLHGTEWAVLSACDTGRGEVQAGEGVRGLRRAFEIAGARTVIMSLWSVEDEAARQWMSALYAARLSRGLSTIEAVREASLALIRRRRETQQSTHPFFWAGFVAAGEWR